MACTPPYVELHCHSAYSFLDGVSLPDELALRKGSTWVLAVQGGRVVGARYLDPPTSG